MTRSHFHVHSHLGNGYLCECDAHYPLTAAERDAALRAERDSWRDYAAEDVAGQTHTVIRGSVRAGHFTIRSGRRGARGYVTVETVEGYQTATDADPAVVKFVPIRPIR